MEELRFAYLAFELRRLFRPDRKRAIGALGKFKPHLEERVFVTLFFLRRYPNMLCFLFDIHEGNAFRDVAITKEFLKGYIPLPERVRDKKISSLDELFSEISELEIIICNRARYTKAKG